LIAIITSTSKAAESHNRFGLRWAVQHCLLAFVLPVALFLVFRPEKYSLTPNGLDPFFYTGYVTNFDDIAREIGSNYYFVSRWSAYLPGRIFAELAGPTNGRLLYRWVLSSGVLLSVWSLGRRWQWSLSQELIVGFSILASPIFARALFTDYVEHFVVPAGCVLLSQALHVSRPPARSIALGVLLALLVVANPYSVVAAVPPLLVYSFGAPNPLTQTAKRSFLIVLGFGSTLLMGLVWFRSRYGIDDVYAPTVSFVRNNTGFVDPLKSPNVQWMAAFLWIYIPGVLLVVFRCNRTLWKKYRHHGGAALWWITLVIYGFQWVDQFLRDGPSLELPYYFVLVYPTIALLTALIVGSVVWTRFTGILTVACWAVLLLRLGPFRNRIAEGLAGLALIGVVLIVVVGISRKFPVSAAALLVLVVVSMQVAAPSYDPTSYHPYNLSPEYQNVFGGETARTDSLLEDTIWLEDELDLLPTDAGLFFAASGEATNMVGIYGPHVTGHLVAISDTFPPIDEPMLASLKAFGANPIVLFGPRENVDRAREVFGQYFVFSELDLGSSPRLGYHLVVLNRSR
jgi:hypothetical protein